MLGGGGYNGGRVPYVAGQGGGMGSNGYQQGSGHPGWGADAGAFGATSAYGGGGGGGWSEEGSAGLGQCPQQEMLNMQMSAMSATASRGKKGGGGGAGRKGGNSYNTQQQGWGNGSAQNRWGGQQQQQQQQQQYYGGNGYDQGYGQYGGSGAYDGGAGMYPQDMPCTPEEQMQWEYAQLEMQAYNMGMSVEDLMMITQVPDEMQPDDEEEAWMEEQLLEAEALVAAKGGGKGGKSSKGGKGGKGGKGSYNSAEDSVGPTEDEMAMFFASSDKKAKEDPAKPASTEKTTPSEGGGTQS